MAWLLKDAPLWVIVFRHCRLKDALLPRRPLHRHDTAKCLVDHRCVDMVVLAAAHQLVLRMQRALHAMRIDTAHA